MASGGAEIGPGTSQSHGFSDALWALDITLARSEASQHGIERLWLPVVQALMGGEELPAQFTEDLKGFTDNTAAQSVLNPRWTGFRGLFSSAAAPTPEVALAAAVRSAEASLLLAVGRFAQQKLVSAAHEYVTCAGRVNAVAAKLESLETRQPSLAPWEHRINFLRAACVQFFPAMIPSSFHWVMKLLGFQPDAGAGILALRLAAAQGGIDTTSSTAATSAFTAAVATATGAGHSAEAAQSGIGVDPAPFATPAAVLLLWIEGFYRRSVQDADVLLGQVLLRSPRALPCSYIGGYVVRRFGDVPLACALFAHCHAGATTAGSEHLKQISLFEMGWCLFRACHWHGSALCFLRFLTEYKAPAYRAWALLHLGYCCAFLGLTSAAKRIMAHLPLECRAAFSFDVFAAQAAAQFNSAGGLQPLATMTYLAYSLGKSGYLLHAAALLQAVESTLLVPVSAAPEWVGVWLPHSTGLAWDSPPTAEDTAYFWFTKAHLALALHAASPAPSQGAAEEGGGGGVHPALTPHLQGVSGFDPPPTTASTRTALGVLQGEGGDTSLHLTPLGGLLGELGGSWGGRTYTDIGSQEHTLLLGLNKTTGVSPPCWLKAEVEGAAAVQGGAPSPLHSWLDLGVGCVSPQAALDCAWAVPPVEVSLVFRDLQPEQASTYALACFATAAGLTGGVKPKHLARAPPPYTPPPPPAGSSPPPPPAASAEGVGLTVAPTHCPVGEEDLVPTGDPPTPTGGLKVEMGGSWIAPHAHYYTASHLLKLARGHKPGSHGAQALLKRVGVALVAAEGGRGPFHFDKPLRRKITALRASMAEV